MADQEDENLVVRLDARGEVRECLRDILLGRTALHPTPVLVRGLSEVGQIRVRDPDLLAGVENRRCPLVKLLGMLLVAANADDDEDMRVLSRSDTREAKQEEQTPQDASRNRSRLGSPRATARAHANPCLRRYPHSAPTRASNSINRIGMSQRSRSSTTVTPRPL